MSVQDLINDLADDIAEDFRERRKLMLEYSRAAECAKQCRIQIDTWERREREAKADIRKVREAFEARGWQLP